MLMHAHVAGRKCDSLGSSQAAQGPGPSSSHLAINAQKDRVDVGLTNPAQTDSLLVAPLYTILYTNGRKALLALQLHRQCQSYWPGQKICSPAACASAATRAVFPTPGLPSRRMDFLTCRARSTRIALRDVGRRLEIERMASLSMNWQRPSLYKKRRDSPCSCSSSCF